MEIPLRSFDDAEVAFRARSECPKRLLVSLAFMRCHGGFIAVEFDDNSPQRQSSFVSLNLARGSDQEATAKSLNSGSSLRAIGFQRRFIRNRPVNNDPIAFFHGELSVRLRGSSVEQVDLDINVPASGLG